ncbi:TOXD [Diaporthe helianthi]|uniref:TOXD n=1 Tax=Diaporthe helianthi TaxID=158607 RepID=A0A2P5HW65_DIAHE|nr:TOXD [Diaporthe helianthi]
MGVPDTFKAAILPRPHAQYVLQDRSLAPLEAGEVSIKVNAAAINPLDWKVRDYNFYIEDYPAVMGSDGAGEIVAVGSGVTNFKEGDRVFFQGIAGKDDFCTFQHYAKMPAELVAKTPKSLSDEQAATVLVSTAAVVTGFYDKSGHGLTPPWAEGGEQAGKGKGVVIIGGSSAVGQYAIQMAKISGFAKIVTNSSSKHHDHLKALGADVVLDRSTQSSAEDFTAALGGVPLDFVFDSISEKETQILGVKIVDATKGETSQIVLVQAVNADAVELGQSLGLKVELKMVYGFGSAPDLRYLGEPMCKHVGGEDGYIAKGRLVPHKPLVISGGLGNIEEALAKLKNGVSGEKVVIRPFDA